MGREVYIWDDKTQSVVTKEEFLKNHIDKNNAGFNIISDITPFQSVVDGSWITTRSQIKEHEKKYNITQVGNDLKPPKKQ